MRCTVWRETQEFTMRLILIDNNSGYIFGEFASNDYTGNYSSDEVLIEAAKHIDADIGAQDRIYTTSRSAPRSTQTGYHVYRADVCGSEQVPAITDGQDQEMIQAVERDCEYFGFVSCTDAT
jgi:hypothetical protein